MTIREYSERDIEQIVALNQRVFSEQEHFDITRDEKWFRWKNIDNHFGKSIVMDNRQILKNDYAISKEQESHLFTYKKRLS